MTVLVLGGTGMLGHKLFQALRTVPVDVYCTMRRKKTEGIYSGIEMFQSDHVIDEVDANNWDQVAQLLEVLRPDVVVNCIGVIKQRDSADDPIQCITLNSLLPHKLANEVANWGGRLIHISTDCVFSGSRGDYDEDDISDANDLYGRTKYLGEVAYGNSVTLRTSIIGRELTNRSSLVEWFLSQETTGKVKGFTRAMYSGLTTLELSRVIIKVINDFPELSGLWQVAGPVISKHDLLVLVREAFGLDIEIVPYHEFVCDRTLSGSRFERATGYSCPSWPQMIAEMAADPTPYDEWYRSDAGDKAAASFALDKKIK